MTVELTTQIDPSFVPTILDHEYEASLPLYEFVFSSVEDARRAQRILFDTGAGEWAPPHGRAVVQDGELVGVMAGALASDLRRARLGAALALARAGIFDDQNLARRMQLAVGTLAQPLETDYYYGVVAITPAARGTDVGPEMSELALQVARDNGATRAIGQTVAGNSRLEAYYEGIGYHWIGESRASDPATGRELHYRHFAQLV